MCYLQDECTLKWSCVFLCCCRQKCLKMVRANRSVHKCCVARNSFVCLFMRSWTCSSVYFSWSDSSISYRFYSTITNFVPSQSTHLASEKYRQDKTNVAFLWRRIHWKLKHLATYTMNWNCLLLLLTLLRLSFSYAYISPVLIRTYIAFVRNRVHKQANTSWP